ncbi:hypothetical protein Tco_0734464 [Tanacetum coccineum]
MTLNEGTTKTTPHLEGSLGDKDLGGNIPPADMELIHTPVADPLGTSAKYQVDETQSTRLRYRSLTKTKGKTSSEVEPDTEPLKLQTYADIQAFLLSNDELDKESDEEEVLAAGDDIDEDPQDDKEVRTPSPKQDQPEPSHGFDFSALLSAVKSLRDHAFKMSGVELSQTALKREISSFRKDTFEIKSMMNEMYAAFRGQSSSAPSSSITPTFALTDIQSNVDGENANTTATK